MPRTPDLEHALTMGPERTTHTQAWEPYLFVRDGCGQWWILVDSEKAEYGRAVTIMRGMAAILPTPGQCVCADYAPDFYATLPNGLPAPGSEWRIPDEQEIIARP